MIALHRARALLVVCVRACVRACVRVRVRVRVRCLSCALVCVLIQWHARPPQVRLVSNFRIEMFYQLQPVPAALGT
jgi:hypothetical protein